MWKSLRDGFRYRKRVGIKGHTGDSGDEQIDIEKVDDWPYSDVLSFLIPTSTKYPRKTTSMGSSETINITENSNDLPADYETKSNYSYVGSCKNINNLVIIFNNFVFNFLQTSKKRKRDIVAESVAGISTAIGKLVDVAQAKASEAAASSSSSEAQPAAPLFRYEYVWKLLESLYAKMDPADVDELNHQAINAAYGKIK